MAASAPAASAASFDRSQYAETVLELGIDHRVPADNRTSRLGGFVAPTPKDTTQNLMWNLSLREAADRQSHLRIPSHRIDVGERVGRRYGAVGFGIVDDGSDEIDGESEGGAILRTHECRILHRGDVGIDPGMVEGSDFVQDPNQVLSAQFAGSVACRHELRQPDFAHCAASVARSRV